MASNQRPVRTLPFPAEQEDSENMMTDVSLSTTLPRPETPGPNVVRRSTRIQNSPKPDYKGTAGTTGRLNTRYDAKIL